MRKMLPQWQTEKQIRDVSQLVVIVLTFERSPHVTRAATKAKDAGMEEERHAIW